MFIYALGITFLSLTFLFPKESIEYHSVIL